MQNIFITKINEWFVEKVIHNDDSLKDFFTAFAAVDVRTVERILNYYLGKSISYLDGGKSADRETFYHGILLGMFSGRTDWEVFSNREGGNGRPDITAFNLQTAEAYIIEAKYSKTEKI